MAWAESLTVTTNNNITFNDWRLPTTVNGPFVWGYDGSTTAGWNISSSEMGHLYSFELENKAIYDINGNPQTGGHSNTGPFNNLRSWYYWSSTGGNNPPYTDCSLAWVFYPIRGEQTLAEKEYWTWFSAIAVRSGDVSAVPAPVPEPTTMLLSRSGWLQTQKEEVITERQGHRGPAFFV
jgi:hypothetical protein